MKLLKKGSWKHRIRGFTVWDLVIVLATAVILIVLFLTPAHGGRGNATRISCMNNLRQVGFAFQVWATDHGDKFPMAVSTNQGGSLEFVGTGEVLPHYLAIFNQLNNPKILTCPADSRKRATAFATLRNKNISYFVGLDAVEPQMILLGDRNITTNGRLISGTLTLTLNSANSVSWTRDLHGQNGNIVLLDGSAQQATVSALKHQIASSTNFPARLAIP